MCRTQKSGLGLFVVAAAEGDEVRVCVGAAAFERDDVVDCESAVAVVAVAVDAASVALAGEAGPRTWPPSAPVPW